MSVTFMVLLLLGIAAALGIYLAVLSHYRPQNAFLIPSCQHVDIDDGFRRCPSSHDSIPLERCLDGRWRLPEGWTYAADLPTSNGNPAMLCPVHAPLHPE